MVIDISKMDEIYVDEEKNTVKIQGGVRNRELYEATGSLGYPFPGGKVLEGTREATSFTIEMRPLLWGFSLFVRNLHMPKSIELG